MKRIILVCLIFVVACATALSAASIAEGTGPPERFTICHGAGLAGTTQYITLEDLPYPAVFGPGGHFNEDGTPSAGHEQDYMGACVTTPPPVDLCPNLDGLQETVPPGYTLVDGICVEDEPEDILLLAGVTFTEATCDAGPSFTLVKTFLVGIGLRPFYSVQGTLVAGKPVAGESYTITALEVEGYTFGDQQTVWTHTYAAAPTDCGEEPPECPNGDLNGAEPGCEAIVPPPPPCVPQNPDGSPGGKDGIPGNDDCARDPEPPPPTDIVPLPEPTPEPPPVVEPPVTTPPVTRPPVAKPKPEEPKTVKPPKTSTDGPVSNPPAPAEPTAEEGELPYTGLGLLPVVLLGASMVASGLGLRRRK